MEDELIQGKVKYIFWSPKSGQAWPDGKTEKIANEFLESDASGLEYRVGSELFLLYVCLGVKEGRAAGRVFVVANEPREDGEIITVNYEIDKDGYIKGFNIESAWDSVLKRFMGFK